MDIAGHLAACTVDQLRSALDTFLVAHTSPAFGSLSKAETELLTLALLVDLGILKEPLVTYEVVTRLHVTRAKARALIYARELRTKDADCLDEELKVALRSPILEKLGDLVSLQVDSPLLSDHIRSRLQKLGYVADGSFSPTLVKLSVDAMAALLENALPEASKDRVRATLVRAGAPDTSLRGILKATLKKIGSKVADDVGEELGSKASKYLEPILDGALDRMKGSVASLFRAEV